MKIFKAFKKYKKKNNINLQPIDLSKQKLLADLSSKELSKFTRLLHKRVFKKGEVVFKQGYPHVVLYLLAYGEVEIFAEEENNKKTHLNTLNGGDHFGEIGLFAESKRTATALCLADSVLYAASKANFKKFVNSHPHVGVKLLLSLLSSLISLSESYPNLLQSNVLLTCENNCMEQIENKKLNNDIEIFELGLLVENKKIFAAGVYDNKYKKISNTQVKEFVYKNLKANAKSLFAICEFLSQKISEQQNI